MMMELFLMTLVVPFLGIFFPLGNIGMMFGFKKMAEKAGKGGKFLPIPFGGILPTVASLFQEKAKAKKTNQTDQTSSDQIGSLLGKRDTGQSLSAVEDDLLRVLLQRRLQRLRGTSGEGAVAPPPSANGDITALLDRLLKGGGGS